MGYAWLLYLLVFVFGFVTCQVFYFLKSTRISIMLLKESQRCALKMALFAIEHHTQSQKLRVYAMRKAGDSNQNILDFLARSEGTINKMKTEFVGQIITSHGKVFKEIVEFKDWERAMTFYNKKELQ